MLFTAFLVTAGVVPVAAQKGRFIEKDGVVAFEVENYLTVTGPWFETAGKSGKAMSIMQGRWTDHMSYEVTTTSPETKFYCWMLGKPAGMGANDIKIFVDRVVQCCSDKANFEQHFSVTSEIKWTNETKTGGKAILTLKPEKHVFNVVRGAEPEGDAKESYIVDKIVLSKSSSAPVGTGPAETVATTAVVVQQNFVVLPDGHNEREMRIYGLAGTHERSPVRITDIFGRKVNKEAHRAGLYIIAPLIQ